MFTKWSVVTGLSCVVMISLVCVPAQETGKPGSIIGVVRFTGQVPPAQKIMTSDGAILMHRDLVVDAKSKGLRFVVALLGSPAQPLAKNVKAVVIDQRDMVFLPRVVVAQEGQPVRFENNDLFNHAVMSTSVHPDNLFNVLTPQGQPFEFKFKAQKAPVQIGCPIHPWMRAWIYVLSHPHAAVTDGQGEFKIEGVPTGKHMVQFAHPDTGLRETQTVEVVAGKATRVDVEWRGVKK